MNEPLGATPLEVGYNIPSAVGLPENEVQTPCLVIDLDAFERNIRKMGDYARQMGVRHRAHGKMHKSIDIALIQADLGGSCGICSQKVSEAECFARGGVQDILITNQVRDPVKIDRMARLPLLGTRIICCVDDIANVADISEAAVRHGTEVECLVELDCGQNRCGVGSSLEAVEIARTIASAENLRFAGLQSYQGSMQHLRSFSERQVAFDQVLNITRETVDALRAQGLACDIVGGGGTGSFLLEGASGVFNELQCGSYAFMDADYGRVRDRDDVPLDRGEWENALFLLTSIMSHVKDDQAVCDAGLKVQSVDSGLPIVWGREDVEYTSCSDEHGIIRDPGGVLRVNDKLRLVPGHCDPTCNLHDWYVGLRNGYVEALWPVSARGLVL